MGSFILPAPHRLPFLVLKVVEKHIGSLRDGASKASYRSFGLLLCGKTLRSHFDIKPLIAFGPLHDNVETFFSEKHV